MRKLLPGGIVASLALVPAITPAAAGEIVVFCPGAVQSVVRPMAKTYEEKTGNTVKFEFGTAGAIARKVADGATGDVVLATDKGLAALAKDQRPRMPGEEALWHYKRGAARALQGRTDDATADLKFAVGADPQNWVNGRARVELGRLALKRGDRTSAANEAKQAETLCDRGNDPVCVQDARSVLRSSNGR